MGSINAFFHSVDVFNKLGIDATIIFQFIIFVVTFFVLEMLFFSKLLFVIRQREDKTIKLDEVANKKFQESEKLALKFNKELQGANIEAQGLFSLKKSEIIEKERSRFKEVENVVNAELDVKREKLEEEFKVKKVNLLKNADELAGALSNRLTT